MKKLVKKILSKKRRRKKSHHAEKTERGDLLEFFNMHSVAKHQKIEGGTLWGLFFRKKSHNAEKTEKGTL